MCFFILTPARAQLVQVLHTNDLHSQLEHANHRPDLGGYARLKTLIREEKQAARMVGIESIALDGGDFLEGSIHYMADKGKLAFEAFNDIGIDAAVLGNHDYLMAADDLEEILADVPPSYALLAANFHVDERFEHINRQIKPVWETVVNGVKVGVLGITLNDMLFKWRLKGAGGIENEISHARKWAKYLRQRGNDVVIALTHIGLGKDKKLAKNIPELDIIVGGHSHLALKEIVYQTSSNGKRIPIVQAGKHGEWLGKLIFNYNRGQKKVEILSYGLQPIQNAAKDPGMLEIIGRSNEKLNELYGKEWLEEVVGYSDLRPSHIKDDSKVWHFFVNDSMLETVDANIAIHAPPLSGGNYPLEQVTRRDLYEGNPRTFDFDDKYGYHVYTADVSGIWIKLIATAAVNLRIPLYFSGISFKWDVKKNGKYKVWGVRVNGRWVNPFRRYRIAFSEAIVRGAYNISRWTRFLLGNGTRTPYSMWGAMEEKFRREYVLAPDYLDRHYQQKSFVSRPIDRVMFPGHVH